MLENWPRLIHGGHEKDESRFLGISDLWCWNFQPGNGKLSITIILISFSNAKFSLVDDLIYKLRPK